jgi:hypothetical protein
MLTGSIRCKMRTSSISRSMITRSIRCGSDIAVPPGHEQAQNGLYPLRSRDPGGRHGVLSESQDERLGAFLSHGRA